jgi:tetratricopeptide (TPR) repeat protein
MAAATLFHDRYGLPLTTRSAEAARRYGEYLDRRLAADSGAADCLRAALEADPEFCLAHAALAAVRKSAGQPEQATESARRAAALAAGVTAREQGHIQTVSALVSEDARRALRLIRTHLDAYPRDAALAQHAVLLLAGGVAEPGEDPRAVRAALLAGLAPHYRDDWWFSSTYAFALNELGDHAAARALVERSLAQYRRNPAAAHVYAHVFYETGDPTGGAAFLADWLPDCDPRAIMHLHISWHLAVFELQLGRFGRAVGAYEAGVSPIKERFGPPTLTEGGAVSLLWRAMLAGYPSAALPWGPARDYAARNTAQAGHMRALWDAYEAAAYAGARDRDGLDALLSRLRAADSGTYPAAQPVVAPLAQGLWAYAAGDWASAAGLLKSIAHAMVRLGGSNEQRDTFEDTYAAALVRAGRLDSAEACLRERLARRPSAQDSFWLGQVLAATERPDEAAACLAAAEGGWRDADHDFPGRASLQQLREALPRSGEQTPVTIKGSRARRDQG